MAGSVPYSSLYTHICIHTYTDPLCVCLCVLCVLCVCVCVSLSLSFSLFLSLFLSVTSCMRASGHTIPALRETTMRRCLRLPSYYNGDIGMFTLRGNQWWIDPRYVHEHPKVDVSFSHSRNQPLTTRSTQPTNPTAHAHVVVRVVTLFS
jgi:hypothetical protein